MSDCRYLLSWVRNLLNLMFILKKNTLTTHTNKLLIVSIKLDCLLPSELL